MVALALKEKILDLFSDEELEVIDGGEWISVGKYDRSVSVVMYENRYYKIFQTRTGSYHTEYHYDDPALIGEVAPKEVTITEWALVGA